MNASINRSLPARVVAVSFIVLILLGNCWFVLALIGWQIPPWFRTTSKGAVFLAVIGALWLTALGVRNRLHGHQNRLP